MKKKIYKIVFIVIGGFLSTNLLTNILTHASTSYTRPNQYSINRIKNGSGESLVEYDFGSFMPHDDAYMKGYAQSSGYNRVHVYLFTNLGSDTQTQDGWGRAIYKVAEVSGADYATFGAGTATSNAGTTRIEVR